MKKTLQFFLLAAVLIPWTMSAQNTLTVCDGTETNEYVPIYGYYADDPQTSQMIFPASMLTSMQGYSIVQMVFYVASDGGNDDNLGDWNVSLGTTTETTLDYDLDEDTPLTQVYSGQLVFDDNLNATTMTVTFNTPYEYTGGNLLVEFDHPTEGGYNHYYFYGIQATDASYSWEEVHDFLPKTTFSYATCVYPGNLTASNVTTTSAVMSWTGDAESYEYELLSPTGSPLVSNTTYMTSTILSGLSTHTNYLFRIRSHCSASDVSDWATYSLTTAICNDACPIHIELRDSYGDGWDGAYLSIVDSLTADTLARLTVLDSLNIVNLPLCPNRYYIVHWTSDIYNYECSYEISTANGTLIAYVTDPDDGRQTAFYHTCEATTPDSVYFYVSVNNPSMGTTDPAPGIYAFAVGDYASIEAIPTEGYIFSDWTVSALGQTFSFPQNPYSNVIPDMLAGMTILVEANFIEDPGVIEEFLVINMNVNNSEWGYTTPEIGRHEYSAGDYVTLTAYPASNNYQFDHWNIAVLGIGDTNIFENPFEMDAIPDDVLGYEYDVTAYFAPVTGIDGADGTFPYIVFANDGNIIIHGAAQQSVRIYDLMGRMVFFTGNASDEQIFRPANTGVYLVKIGDLSTRRVFVK